MPEEPKDAAEPRNVPQAPDLENRGAPVDEPPGLYGAQGRPEGEVPPVMPDWPPGQQPPGTNPTVEPAEDPARVPVPGSIPGIERGEDRQLGEAVKPQGAPGAPRPPHAGTNSPAHAQNPPHASPKSDDKDKKDDHRR